MESEVTDCQMLLALASTASGQACGAENYCIDWWAIDSVEEMFAESFGGQWQLSGTIGRDGGMLCLL